MSDPADVDKLVSDFLGELNELSDSLGVAQGKPAQNSKAGPSVDVHPGRPEDPQIRAAAQAPAETAKEGEPSQPVSSKPVSCRNIDILLMDQAPPPSTAAKVEEDEFPHSCKVLYDSPASRLRRAAKRRMRALVWAAAAVALLGLLGALYLLDPFGPTDAKTAVTPAPQASGATPEHSSISPAVAIDTIVPSYPRAARRLGIRGVVELYVDVDEQGRVVSAIAVSGPSLLRSAAAQAVAKCRFKPAHRDGVSLRSTVKVSVAFNPS